MSSAAQEVCETLGIRELRGVYAREIDHGSYEKATEVFTEDAVVNY